jgi:outer membrane protein assembly factor BamB
MKKITKHFFILTALSLTLNACSTFFDKDNTPPPATLVEFKPSLQVQPLWHTRTGSGFENDNLKLTPSISGQTIFTASNNGTVAANDKVTGKSLWQIYTGTQITGGASASGNAVYVGTGNGGTISLNQLNGQLNWKANTTTEILAPAAASQGTVVVKSIDGNIRAFSANDGHTLWNYHEASPNLILRGASAPQISQGSTIVGFETGNLAKLNLRNGRVDWQTVVAEPEGIFAIQRMVDIDANPIVVGGRVFAATYQGRVAAMTLGSGTEIWHKDISSFSGIASDGGQVFVSDAHSHLWAFNAANGNTNWQQNDLNARTITGPALMQNYLVVGDAEGYLHWMSKQDGHFVARLFVNKSGIIATPIVDNNILYVYTKDGHLVAYKVV